MTTQALAPLATDALATKATVTQVDRRKGSDQRGWAGVSGRFSADVSRDDGATITRSGRRSVRSTGPDLRRTHPAAPHGRPGGASAPSLLDAAALAARARAVQACSPRISNTALHSGEPSVAPVPARRLSSSGAMSWRLTDRGIAVVLALFAILMVTAAVVVVHTALVVTSTDTVAFSAEGA